jgi:hypothetical protein
MPSPICWDLHTPLIDAAVYERNADHTYAERTPTPAEKKVLLKGFRQGDRLAVLYDTYEPLYSVPLPGKTMTLWKALEVLEKTLQTPIPKSSPMTRLVYLLASRFLGSKNRMRITKEYEAGRLRFVDLVGDHSGFHGDMTRNPDGVFTYTLDS